MAKKLLIGGGSTAEVVSVALAHPSALIRDVIIEALSSDPLIAVVGAAVQLNDLKAQCSSNRPQVLVCATEFGDGRLVELLPALVAEGTRILLLGDDGPNETTSTLLLAGASGLLFLNDAAGDDLSASVHAVAAGKTALHPDVALAVLEQWRAMRTAPAIQTLAEVKISDRESAVLEAIAAGLTTREISKRLAIAEKTVEAHKSRIYAKLGAKNQAHAVAVAAELGLLSLD